MKKYDNVLMRTAHVWSDMSYCKRRKVGAVLAKDSYIISVGYNGTIRGAKNECETTCTACAGQGCLVCEYKGIVTNPEVLHAEANCLTAAMQHGISTTGCSLYVTTSPCIHCAKLIVQAGVTRVVYQEEYKDAQGLLLLIKSGVEICQIQHL